MRGEQNFPTLVAKVVGSYMRVFTVYATYIESFFYNIWAVDQCVEL